MRQITDIQVHKSMIISLSFCLHTRRVSCLFSWTRIEYSSEKVMRVTVQIAYLPFQCNHSIHSNRCVISQFICKQIKLQFYSCILKVKPSSSFAGMRKYGSDMIYYSVLYLSIFRKPVLITSLQIMNRGVAIPLELSVSQLVLLGGSCSFRLLGQLSGVQVFIHSANTKYLLRTVPYPEDTEMEEKHKPFCIGFCILRRKGNVEKK